MSSQVGTSGTRLPSTRYFSGSYNNINDTVARTSGSSSSSNYLAFQQASTGTAHGMADGRLVRHHTGTTGPLFVGNGPHLASRTGQASSSSFQSATTTGVGNKQRVAVASSLSRNPTGLALVFTTSASNKCLQ
jgi:hypothetical protein